LMVSISLSVKTAIVKGISLFAPRPMSLRHIHATRH
jgi:hypothetical protein